MELRKCRRCAQNEVTYDNDSSSTSNDDGSAFEDLEEDRSNSPQQPASALGAEVSGSSGDVVMPKL